MTEEQKNTVHKAYHASKHGFRKYLGAMMLETKADGKEAVSLVRVLTLALFAMCVMRWIGMTPDGSGDVPASMLQTLWGLLGLKGVEKVAGSFTAGKSQA